MEIHLDHVTENIPQAGDVNIEMQDILLKEMSMRDKKESKISQRGLADFDTGQKEKRK